MKGYIIDVVNCLSLFTGSNDRGSILFSCNSIKHFLFVSLYRNESSKKQKKCLKLLSLSRVSLSFYHQDSSLVWKDESLPPCSNIFQFTFLIRSRLRVLSFEMYTQPGLFLISINSCIHNDVKREEVSRHTFDSDVWTLHEFLPQPKTKKNTQCAYKCYYIHVMTFSNRLKCLALCRLASSMYDYKIGLNNVHSIDGNAMVYTIVSILSNVIPDACNHTLWCRPGSHRRNYTRKMNIVMQHVYNRRIAFYTHTKKIRENIS